MLNTLFGTDAIKSSFNNYKSAQLEFNQLIQDKGFNKKNINDYTSALDGLTLSQQKAIVSSSNLNERQKQVMTRRLEQTAATKAASASTDVNTAANVTNSLSLKGVAASAKAAWAAMSALNKVMIIVAVISTVTTLISRLGESIEETKEKADSFANSMKELKDKTKANSSTLRKLKADYNKLSQGVSATGSNIHLTTEEYDKYKDIVSQISDIIPDLTTMYNEQGEAIGFAEGKLADLNKAYNEYTQKRATKMLVEGDEQGNTASDIVNNIKGMSDVSWTKDVWSYLAVGDWADVSDDVPITEILGALKELKDYDYKNYDSATHPRNNWSTGLQKAMDDVLEKAGISLEEAGNIPEDEIENFYRKRIQSLISSYEMQINNAYDNVRGLIEAHMMANDAFLDLTPEESTVLLNIVPRISNEALEDNGIANVNTGEVSQASIAQFADNITEKMANDEQFSEAIRNLYAIDFDTADETVREVRQQIYDYMKYIGTELDLEHYIYAYDLLGFNLLGYSTGDSHMINAAENKFGLTNSQLEENFSMSEIKTAYEEISAEGIKTVEDLEHALKRLEIKKKKDSLDVFWNADDFTETREKLLDLAKSGELSEKTLESTKEYKEFLDKTGVSAEKAKGYILSLLSATEKLAMASKGTDPLFNAYEEYLSKGFITATTLEGLPDAFKKLKGYSEFEAIAGNPNSENDEVEQAFEDLLTEWYQDNDILNGITEDNKETYIANMKDKHIVNAEEIADTYLESSELLKNAEAEYEQYVTKNKDAYVDYIISKGELDKTYFDQIGGANAQLFALLGAAYKDDLENWCDLIDKKAYAQKRLKEEIAGDESKWDPTKTITENAAANGYSVAEAQRLASEYYAAERKEKEAYETLQKDLAATKSNYEINFGDIKDKSSSTEKFDWIETRISRLDREISNIDKTVDSTYKRWATRNDEIGKSTDKLTKKLQDQKKAANYYLNKANSVTGLTNTEKDLIKNGDILITEETDDAKKKAIQDFKEYWEAYLEAFDGQQDTRDEIVNNFIEAFDMIASEYDSRISMIESRGSIIDALIGQQEANGHIVNKDYYKQLYDIEKDNITELELKKKGLVEKLQKAWLGDGNGNKVEAYSEEWYRMKADINEVEEALIEANTQLIEYNNEIRQINWDVFDKQQEAIGRVREEAEFFINLMEEEDLFDKETGAITEYGKATMGLHAVNYNAYLKQAQDYGKELVEVNKELEKDPYDQEVIERREELLGLQRDMITSAQDEKQAMIDLTSDGYDAMLEALDEIIEKKKEALNVEKDLYDYQKNVAEQTKNIASLEKQIAAYSGDDSEETKAKVQQLKVSLDEAKQNLQETEYDRWKQDQEQMLDTLSNDAKEWINERLDHEDELIEGILNAVDGDSDSIKNTLQNVASDVGYQFSTQLTSAFGEGGVLANTDSILTTIANYVATIAGGSNINTSSDTKNTSGGTTTSGGSNGTSGGTNSSNNNDKKDNEKQTQSWGSWFVKKANSYPKDKLSKDTSIVDRLAWLGYDNSFDARAKYFKAMGGSGVYTGSEAQNTWMLSEMKKHKGYAKGASRIKQSQMAWTQENGQELIYRASDGAMLTPLGAGDAVFTSDMTRRLWDIASAPEIFSGLTSVNLPKGMASTRTNSAVQNDVVMNISLPNVVDVDGFVNELRTNKKFEKVVQSMTIGSVISGSNSLSKFKY